MSDKITYADDVLKEIKKVYQETCFMPTMRELAETFECSTSTIHRCYKELHRSGKLIQSGDRKRYRLLRHEIVKLINVWGEVNRTKKGE